MARRIFYFSGYRMKVFEWHDRRLIGSYEFDPDDAGFAQFDEYLAGATAIPAQLFVDLIEEDFHRERIPHLTGADRKAMVNRLLERHYRGEKHVHVQLIARSAEGRRDDHVLLSALTNFEILGPWLKHLNDHKVPLAGIWSLPLVTHQLLPAIGQTEKNVLILSRHIRSAQRESYFQDGKLILSRQAKLDRDKRDDETATGSLDNLVSGTQQIHIFLTNQRIMGFTDVLNVHCILPRDWADEARLMSKDTNTIKYHFLSLQGLFAHYKLENCENEEADALFAYLCSAQALTQDHYATPEEKIYYRRFKLDKLITSVTILGSIVIFVCACLLWLNSMELGQKQQIVEIQRQALEARYQREFSEIQLRLADADNVQASVELVRRLQAEARFNPSDLFEYFGVVFGDPRFDPIRLDHFGWKKFTARELRVLLKTEQAEVAETVQKSQILMDDGAEDPANAGLQALISLGGYCKCGHRPYNETVALLNELADALRKVPRVNHVIIQKMPVDIRPAMSFSDDTGIDGKITNIEKDKEDNHFEIVVGMDAEVRPHD